jgi:hypothetical protein
MNIRTAAAPIAAVAIQPRIMIDRPAVKAPITDFFETSRMITTIKGYGDDPVDDCTPAAVSVWHGRR